MELILVVALSLAGVAVFAGDLVASLGKVIAGTAEVFAEEKDDGAREGGRMMGDVRRALGDASSASAFIDSAERYEDMIFQGFGSRSDFARARMVVTELERCYREETGPWSVEGERRIAVIHLMHRFWLVIGTDDEIPRRLSAMVAAAGRGDAEHALATYYEEMSGGATGATREDVLRRYERNRVTWGIAAPERSARLSAPTAR